MKKRKYLKFVLYFLVLLSLILNVYFLLPKPHSASISQGYYISNPTNGIGGIYGISIWPNNDVRLYDSANKVVFQGKLEFYKDENYYLMKTDSAVYQISVQDDVIFLPVKQNNMIVSRLFTKVDDAPVTYG